MQLVSRNGEGLDEGVPAGRARRGPAAGGNRAPRRRGRRGAAERSDELPGAPAPRPTRSGAARLLRVRPAAPRRLGPAGGEARGAQGGAAAPARVGARGPALQRSRARPGPRVLREGTRGRPRGRREQARRRSLSRGTRRRLAEGEVPAEPGGGDRRLDAAVGRRESIGALLVGFHEDGQLVYAGKVGSGFSERLLADLAAPPGGAASGRRRPFASVPAELRQGVHWVEPDLVAQVEFTEWTDEGRMRQPVFLGLRDDRDARHVVRERPGTVEGGGVDTVAAGRPWEALRQHATRTRAVERRGGRRPPRRAAHPPRPRLLSRPRLHQAGPRALLRVDRRRGAAASRRPPAHAGALPGRDRRRDASTRSTRASGRRPQVRRFAVPGKSRGVPLRGLGARPRGARAGRDPRDPSLELARGPARGAGPGDLRPRPRRGAAVLPRHRGGTARAGPAERSGGSRAS